MEERKKDPINPKIPDMRGAPTTQAGTSIIKLSRKERKEQKRVERTLLEYVNAYLAVSSTSKNKKVIEDKFTECNHKWIAYALKWNADYTNSLVIRITDFTNFIENYEKNNQA